MAGRDLLADTAAQTQPGGGRDLLAPEPKNVTPRGTDPRKKPKISGLTNASDFLELPMAFKNALLEDMDQGGVGNVGPNIPFLGPLVQNVPLHPFAHGFPHLSDVWHKSKPAIARLAALAPETQQNASTLHDLVLRYGEGALPDLQALAAAGDKQAQSRVKSPIKNAAWTFGAETLNPSNVATGEILGLAGNLAKRGYGAVRATGVGERVLKPAEEIIRKNITDPLGRKFNRFYDLLHSDVPHALNFGVARVGERAQTERRIQQWVDRIFGTGELSRAQKEEVVRRYQGLTPDPNIPDPKVGKSLDFRARMLERAITRTGNELTKHGLLDDAQMFNNGKYFAMREFGGRPVYQWVEDVGQDEMKPKTVPREMVLSRGYARTGHKTRTNLDEARALGLSEHFDPAHQLYNDLLQKWNDIQGLQNQRMLNSMPVEEGGSVMARSPIEYYRDTQLGREYYGKGAAGEKAAKKSLTRNVRPAMQRAAVRDALAGQIPGVSPADLPAQDVNAATAAIFDRRMPNATRMYGRLQGLKNTDASFRRVLKASLSSTQHVSDAFEQIPAAAAARAEKIYGSGFKSGLGKAADEYIHDLYQRRLENPAYMGGGYVDEYGQEIATGNAQAAKGYVGKPFTQQDIIDLRKAINSATGKKLREDQVKELAERAFDTIGQARDLPGEFEEATMPLMKRGVVASMRATDKVGEIQKRFADKMAEAAKDYAQARVDVGLKRKIQDRVDDLIGEYIDKTLPHTEHLPEGFEKEFGGYKREGGVALRESDLRMNMPRGEDSKHTVLHQDFYNFIRDSREVEAPEEDRTPAAKFFALLANLARAGMILGLAPHGIWNLGSHYLAAARDLGVSSGKALENLTARPPEFWTHASEQLGAQPNFNMSNFGFRHVLGKNAWKSILRDDGHEYSASDATIRSSPTRELPFAAKLDKVLSQGVHLPESLPGKLAGAKVLPGWNDQTHLVFDVMEKRYATHLFTDAVLSFAKRAGKDGLSDAEKVHEFGGEAARYVRKSLGDYANLTPYEKNWKLNRVFFFYPWMKTVVPFWLKRIASHAGMWNNPVHTVEMANEQQGDTDPSSNPFTVDLGKLPNGKFRRYTLPLPQRVLNPVAQLAAIPFDFSQNGKKAALDDTLPAINYLQGHLNPNIGVPLEAALAARGASDKFGVLNVDTHASPAGQFKQIASRLASSYAPPIEDLNRYHEDPVGAITTFLAGGFLSSGQSDADKRRDSALKSTMGRAIDAMRKPGPSYDPEGADLLDEFMNALLERNAAKVEEARKAFLAHKRSESGRNLLEGE
jgi:hypothetical protein